MTTENNTGQLKRRTILKAIGAAGAVGAVAGGTTGPAAAQETCCVSTTFLTDRAYFGQDTFADRAKVTDSVDKIELSDPNTCNKISYDLYEMTSSLTSSTCVFDGVVLFLAIPSDGPSLSVGDVIACNEVDDACSTDPNSEGDNNQVEVLLCSTNNRPNAVDDAYSTVEDTGLIVFPPGVLDNDSDPDANDTLTASLVSGSGPSNGTLNLSSDGSFSYMPNLNYNGTDSFEYEASDGKGGTDTAVVSLTVTPVNDDPVAVDDAYSTDQATELKVSAPGVLDNDSDPDANDTLTASLVSGSGPSNGTLNLQAGGSFSYMPDSGFVGTDSFVYAAADGNGGTDEATVTITVVATGPFLRLPQGLDCRDIDQWTLLIQGDDPVDVGDTICGQSCDEYKVMIKPPRGGPAYQTVLCGTDLNNLSGERYEIEACATCSTPNYAGLTLRPIRNRGA